MEWIDFKHHYSKKYDFLSRVKVHCVNAKLSIQTLDSQYSLHPLIYYSSGLSLDSIQNHRNLALAFPNKSDIAIWIALISALNTIKQEVTQEGFSKNLEFDKGEYLLINDCVVRFEEEYFCDKRNRREIKVTCGKKGQDIYRVPLNLKLNFQKTNKRRLSALSKLSATCQTEQATLDGLLSTETMGNFSLLHNNVILVNSFVNFEKFKSNTAINQEKPSSLFLWGKLTSEIEIKSSENNQVMRNNPSCLIANGLYSIPEYLELNPNRTKAIIIDGYSSIENTPDLFSELLYDFNIPIIVVLNSQDRKSLNELIKKDFFLWRWDSQHIEKSDSIVSIQNSKLDPFEQFNNSLRNYQDQEVNKIVCSDPVLEQILSLVYQLNREIDKQENPSLQDLAKSLWNQVNQLVQLIHLPDKEWHNHFIERAELLYKSFKENSPYMGDIIKNSLKELFGLTLDFANNALLERTSKTKEIRKLLSNSKEKFTIIVLYRESFAIEAAKKYWSEQLIGTRSELEIITLRQFFKEKSNFIESKIIICGWLGGDKTSKILHTYTLGKVYAFFYSLEDNWWKSAQQRWASETPHNMSNKEFSKLTGIEESELNFLGINDVDKKTYSPKFSSTILDLEDSINLKRIDRYISRVSSEQEAFTKVKLIVFVNEDYCFMTESKKYPIIQLESKDKDIGLSVEKVLLKKAQDISVGDLVAFNNSCKDMVRQRAEKMLKDDRKLYLRETASLWQKALRECYETLDGNFNLLLDHLNLYGCEKGEQTIKKWLFDEDMLGPKKEKDIEIIMQATGNQELKENIEQVFKSISDLNSYHQKAGHELKKQLIDALKDKILDDEANYIYTQSFGEVSLLEVSKIERWREVPIPPYRLNTLISGQGY